MELKKEFKCVIDVNGQPVELSFRLVHVPRGCKYFVLASTLRGIVSSFEISADTEHNWQVIPPAPVWLSSLEDRLAALMDEMRFDQK